MKLPYAICISSSNQLYSGTGRVIFDWMLYASKVFDFHIFMDCSDVRNAAVGREACKNGGFSFHLIPPGLRAGCPDYGAAPFQLIRQLAELDFACLELHSWANAGINRAILPLVGRDTFLIYTPHTQPTWTLPGWSQFDSVEGAFIETLAASNLVCALSPHEYEVLISRGARYGACHNIGNGIDTSKFHPGRQRKSGVLTVFDFKEPRKRLDLHVAAFEALIKYNADLHIALAGRGSREAVIPPALQARVSRFGYIDEATLVALYQNSACFVLLSDYEAFGLPIAESLCCGTPVVISRNPVMESLFQDMPGVYMVDNVDSDAAAKAIAEAVALPEVSTRFISEAARSRFCWETTYGRKLHLVLDGLGARR